MCGTEESVIAMLCWWIPSVDEFKNMEPDIGAARWVVNSCRYVIMDGHHRQQAILEAKKRGMLPDLVRVLHQTQPQCKPVELCGNIVVYLSVCR